MSASTVSDIIRGGTRLLAKLLGLLMKADSPIA